MPNFWFESSIFEYLIYTFMLHFHVSNCSIMFVVPVLILQDALVYPEPGLTQVLKQIVNHQQKYKVETANLSAN